MRFLKLAFLLMIGICSFAFSQVETGHYYLMSYFKNNYPGLGDKAGVFFATSTDGITWTELNNGKPILTAAGLGEGLVRDPYLFFDAITQMFHLVYTTGWNTKNIGYTNIMPADGKDFKIQNNWAQQVAIPIGESVTNTDCCWAPEILYDEIQNKYMIYLSIDVKIDGKRGYYALTSDFKTFTKTSQFFDPGFSEIDGDIIKIADKNYTLFFKDEREGYKKIYYVTGPTPQGPWSAVSSNSINGIMMNVEGPSAIKIGNEYRVYFDPYNTRQNYRMVKSTDLATWKEGPMVRTVADTMTYFYYSHCNVLEVPKNIYFWITTGALAVKQNARPLSPVYSTGARFEVPGVYDIMGKKIVTGLSQPSQNAAVLPAGFHVTVDKDKKVVRDLQTQK